MVIPRITMTATSKCTNFIHFFTINGYLDGNGPILTMHKGEHVRWYVFANPNELDAWTFTPHTGTARPLR